MITVSFDWSWVSFVAGVVATVAVAFIVSLSVAIKQYRKSMPKHRR